MNHQYITPELITALMPDEQRKLATWYFAQIKHDDDIVHIFIPEEEDGPYAGIFEGSYDAEYEFGYPEDYQGSLMHHEGRMLPLLSIGEMIAFLHEYDDDNLAFRLHLLLHEGTRETGNRWSFDADALLITLWEGIKEVLRNG